MQELKIDTGVEEFRVNGRGVLRFNPADPNLYHRFFAAGKTLQQYDAELTAATEKCADAQAGLPCCASMTAKSRRFCRRFSARRMTLTRFWTA